MPQPARVGWHAFILQGARQPAADQEPERHGTQPLASPLVKPEGDGREARQRPKGGQPQRCRGLADRAAGRTGLAALRNVLIPMNYREQIPVHNQTSTALSRNPRLIGYARVSTDDQDLSLQVEALTKHGIPSKGIFMDNLSGAKTDRPGLAKCRSTLQSGDILVVWRLDRLGRSRRHLITLVEDLRKENIGFRSINEGAIDTTCARGGTDLQYLLGAGPVRAPADSGANQSRVGGGAGSWPPRRPS